MKKAIIFGPLIVAVGLSWLDSRAQTAPRARIQSIWVEKTNVVVRVEASSSLAKVTLESSGRVGRRAWEPRAVQFVSADSETVELTFRIPLSPALEILRVRGDMADGILPSNFYTGTNKFVASTGTGGFDYGPVTAAPTDRSVETGGATEPREVVESDIWKLDGDALYFFNQNRGLQVIDVTNPDSPNITGEYELVAAGEQMYVLDHNKIVLLAGNGCSGESRIVLLEVSGGVPRLVKELPVLKSAGSGMSIAESRLVGTALYVVANYWQARLVPARDGSMVEQWESGSEIVSFDLSDFANASEKSREWVPGNGNAVTATDRFLFVAQYRYDSSSGGNATINCFDISAPDGAFTKLSTISVSGLVKDKFKMHLNGNVFSVVTQLDFFGGRSTYLHTYSIEDPRSPRPLGRLKIIDNETLFATRFHGDLLYAVTFFVVDPLWVIDLSDPAAPKKVGELEIPGYSTYLQPLGDKLLAMGVDRTNGYQRTVVQLFDVAIPARAALVSKVWIGEGWSSSEANSDEKAFGVLPEEKLLLVPFASSSDAGYVQGVQLIDLEPGRLVKRGVIPHKMGPRRATVHKQRILSVSSRELLTVDHSDRDQPRVVATTELSWAADRVHLVGNFLIEVDANHSEAPMLRVVNAENAGTLLKSLLLTNLPFMGSAEIQDRLYVLQGRAVEYIYPAVYNPTNWFPIRTNPAVMVLSVFDLGQLPDLPLTARAIKEGSTNQFFGQYEGLRVKPDLLVWAARNHGVYPWFWRGGGPEVDIARAGPANGIAAPIDIWYPRWGGGSGHLIATEIGATPAFSSEVALNGTNGWWNFGDAFTVNGLVYTSHQASEFDPTIDPPPYTNVCWNGTEYQSCVEDPKPGIWVQRYYLDVVDFNDAKDPLVRKPANIPGSLIGIHRAGELLYTRGFQLGRAFYNGAEESVAASSYDGVQARLIATLPLTENGWSRPTLADSGFVYLGVPPGANNAAALEVWTLSSSGKFERLNSQSLGSAPHRLDKIGPMLVAQGSDIRLFDASTPELPRPIGAGQPNVCYGVLLDGADGEIERGLWVPIGWYGAIKIPVTARE